MGLHLQRNQKIPSKLQFCFAGSLRRHNDCSLHGRLRPASYPNMPQARGTCHGELDPFPITALNSDVLGRHGSSDPYQR